LASGFIPPTRRVPAFSAIDAVKRGPWPKKPANGRLIS
jgi:hypothetical protein